MAHADRSPLLLGCDFSSAPSARKPIVLALGRLDGQRLTLQRLVRSTTLPGFAGVLHQEPRWIGAFDLPFGLPRALVESLGWPTEWAACMAHYAAMTRSSIREAFVGFCASRPAGGKFAHRGVDQRAGSSPSMKWVNPPVAWMLHAGLPLLLQAGAHFPGLQPAQAARPARVALEGYPGLLAREILGRRSYKSDDVHRQTPGRLTARMELLAALYAGQTRLGLSLACTAAQRAELVQDARGDALDATLCLLQAAWGLQRFEAGDPLYGLPAELDPLEGWIVTA